MNPRHLLRIFPILLLFVALFVFGFFGRPFVSELTYNITITSLIFLFSFFSLLKIMGSKSEFFLSVHPFIRLLMTLSLSGMTAISATNFSFFGFSFFLFDIFSLTEFSVFYFIINGFFVFSFIAFLFFVAFSLGNLSSVVASFFVLVALFNFLPRTFLASYSSYSVVSLGILLIIYLPLLFLRIGKSFKPKKNLKEKFTKLVKKANEEKIFED